MNDYLIVELLNSINSIIYQPIQQTQRIKYTTYDVSEKYIIFGASSGGLYVFNRHPCSFIKLIPSTEGSVVHLSISSDEKYIAVATVKGTLCIFDNNNNNAITKNVQIYTEHQGNIITAMKWNHNSNELYSGDNTGKISVVIITNFITKTMFQTPCSTIIQLDSRIVQLDWGSYFLLVSTLSRVYLCDTQSEHYRQIGKKIREGEFGACFFGTKFSYTLPSERKIQLGSFSILNDKDSFVSYDGLENFKIFCARPGARIWEVQLNGTVIRTHQFKQAFIKGSNRVITLEDNTDSRLKFKSSNIDSSDLNSFNFNFTKMSILNSNFILTFQRNGLYILDPQNVAVIFWTDVFKDIVDVKIVNKFIYLWTSKNRLHILLFSNLENFIINALLNRNYLLCADLCVCYQVHIKKMLPLSKKLHLLTGLSEKLSDFNESSELLNQIEPILIMIRDHFSNRQAAQKLSSGIFVVDNAHFVNNVLLESNTQIVDKCPTSENIPSTSSQSNDVEDVLTDQIVENNISTTSIDICCSSTQESNKKYNFLLEEYELNKINTNYKTNILENVFASCENIQEIIDILNGFRTFAEQMNTDENDVKIWCSNTCLKYVTAHADKFSTKDIEANVYVKEAFESINQATTVNACRCGYPLPNANAIEPKFPRIGQVLVNYFWEQNSSTELCHKVPYLWRDVLMLRKNDDISLILALLVQYADMTILIKFLNKFTYDLWSDLVQNLIQLKRRRCLHCEQTFNCDQNGFAWNNIADEMIKSIGAESTVGLLLQNAEDIPKSELSLAFYQSCIFSTILDNFDAKLRVKAVQYVHGVHETERTAKHFGKLIEKSLINSETSCSFNYAMNFNKRDCYRCNMPLQTPVLCKEKYVELPCGHILHNICYQLEEHKC